MKSLQQHYRPLYAAKLFLNIACAIPMQIHTSSLLSLSCFHFNGIFFYFEIKVNTDEKFSISLFSCLSILSFSASTHVVWDILIQIRYFNASKMTYFLRKGFFKFYAFRVQHSFNRYMQKLIELLRTIKVFEMLRTVINQFDLFIFCSVSSSDRLLLPKRT